MQLLKHVMESTSFALSVIYNVHLILAISDLLNIIIRFYHFKEFKLSASVVSGSPRDPRFVGSNLAEFDGFF